jgi:hypothetical protein
VATLTVALCAINAQQVCAQSGNSVTVTAKAGSAAGQVDVTATSTAAAGWGTQGVALDYGNYQFVQDPNFPNDPTKKKKTWVSGMPAGSFPVTVFGNPARHTFRGLTPGVNYTIRATQTWVNYTVVPPRSETKEAITNVQAP